MDETEEILEGKTISMAQNIGVEMTQDDISVVHRLGKPSGEDGGRPRPVIVKFTRRKKRNELLKNKNKLKLDRDKKIYINEDLTPMRAAMFRLLKEHEKVKTVTTRDCKMIVRTHEKPDEPVTIETPEHLLKIGIRDLDWKRLKLDEFILNFEEE